MNLSSAGTLLLERLHALVAKELAPLAARIDQEGLYPEEFLRHLGAIGGFGACVPRALGGLGLGLADQIQVTRVVGAECGSTAFLVWCQAVSAWYLLHAPNETVRARYLAPVAKGELFSGSGMSNAVKHLAGIEGIHLHARPDGDGYRVNGVLPWVSNLGKDHLLISAAAVAGEGYLMFTVRCGVPGLSLNPCPAFSGLQGTRTLNPRFRDMHIEAADVIAHPPQFAHFMERIKPGFLLEQAGMALGVVEGCIGSIRHYNAVRSQTNAFLDDGEDVLRAELKELETRCANLAVLAQDGRAALRDVLALRARASELVLRAANSAVLHAGARGYLAKSPVQRRMREAIFVSIVTPALKHLRKEIHDTEAAQARPVAA